MDHQRNSERTLREFVFELNGYFQKWIDGLEIVDFNFLKDLMVTDQLKRRVLCEIRDHFVDELPKIVSPSKLAEILDLYESVREDCKKLAKKDMFLERKNNFSFNSKYVDNRNASFAPYGKQDSMANNYKAKTPISNKFTCYSFRGEAHKAPFCTNVVQQTFNRLRSKRSAAVS